MVLRILHPISAQTLLDFAPKSDEKNAPGRLSSWARALEAIVCRPGPLRELPRRYFAAPLGGLGEPWAAPGGTWFAPDGSQGGSEGYLFP